jgi:hypothetical protein
MIHTDTELRDFTLSLTLPKVEETTAWGNPCLKAHGTLWVLWSPYVDAAVFKCGFDERERLLQADPDTFLLHHHYAKHRLILVRAGRIASDWARGRLLVRRWRDAAPKRWLQTWETTRN